MAAIPAPQAAFARAAIEFVFAGKGLVSKDLGSSSDAFLVLYQRRATLGNQWQLVGRTETRKDDSSPSWNTNVVIPFIFEENQELRAEVYDEDVAGMPLDKQDFIGEAFFTVAQVLAKQGHLALTLNNPRSVLQRNGGILHVFAEQVRRVLQTAPVDNGPIDRNLIADVPSFPEWYRPARPIMPFDAWRASLGATPMEPFVEQVQHARFTFAGKSLEKKDFFGSSDPYFKLSRMVPGEPDEGGSHMLAYQSEVIMKNLNPVWKVFEVSTQKLCNEDMNRPLLIEVFDWDQVGSHDLIGTCRTSLSDLLARAANQQPLPLIEKARVGKKNYVSSGYLVVAAAQLFAVPVPSQRPASSEALVNMYRNYATQTFNSQRAALDRAVGLQAAEEEAKMQFMQYVRGGLELNFVVSIDFTGSNGDPKSPNSLHYLGGDRPNQYMEAISAIGNIVAAYDSDKMFPTFCFGGALSAAGRERANGGCTGYQFPLTFDDAHPEVAGVDGILRAYQTAWEFTQLSGPTKFAPIIDQAAMTAQFMGCNQQRQKYLILLILTDGEFNDEAATIRSIIKASCLPMSIVIVGIGAADFTAMDRLDGDGQMLRAGGAVAVRDIVQFVPFRNFKGLDPSFLAKETLAEVPNQVVKFLHANNIQPNPPPQFNIANVLAQDVNAAAAGVANLAVTN